MENVVDKKTITRKWSLWMADSVIEKFPKLRNRWAYDYGVLCKGLEKVYAATKDKKYYTYIENNMDYFVSDDGNIKYYEKLSFNLDFVNNGKTLLYLYQSSGKEKYKRAVELLRQQLAEHPRTMEGGFWHKKIYPNQMWLDGLYMAQPFYAEYISVFDDIKDFSDVALQFHLVEKHLKNPKTHLLYHGYDDTKTMFWADKDTGCSSQYWGRSIGWYSCALVDTLDYIDDEKIQKEFVAMIKDLAIGLKCVQHPQSGLWYQVLDKYSEYGNYPECSCSCMFVYFLMKAVRKGYIDDEYIQVAQKAYYGIIRKFIEVDEKGNLNLKGTVYVSGLGGDKYRDGSYEYYISEPNQINNLLGIGAFLMASTEMEK